LPVPDYLKGYFDDIDAAMLSGDTFFDKECMEKEVNDSEGS